MLEGLPIMLALCFRLWHAYYAQNYASIIDAGLSLIEIHMYIITKYDQICENRSYLKFCALRITNLNIECTVLLLWYTCNTVMVDIIIIYMVQLYNYV